MKQTYVGRSPFLTLLTFFALVLGSQWTFGQTFNGTFGDATAVSSYAGCTDLEANATSETFQGWQISGSHLANAVADNSTPPCYNFSGNTLKNVESNTGIKIWAKKASNANLRCSTTGFEAGKTYKFSTELKAGANSHVGKIIRLGFQYNTGTESKNVYSDEIEIPQNKTNFEKNLTIPEDKTANSEISFRIWFYNSDLKKDDGSNDSTLNKTIILYSVGAEELSECNFSITNESISSNCQGQTSSLDNYDITIPFTGAETGSYTITATDQLGETYTITGDLGTATDGEGNITIANIPEYRNITVNIIHPSSEACNKNIEITAPLCGSRYEYYTDNTPAGKNINSSDNLKIVNYGNGLETGSVSNPDSEAPLTGTDVLAIVAGNPHNATEDYTKTIEFGDDTELSALIIENTAKEVSINKGNNLKINDLFLLNRSFTIKSTPSGFSSLIVDNNNIFISNNAYINYNRYVPQNGQNDLVGPVVKNFSAKDLYSINNEKNYRIAGSKDDTKTKIGVGRHTTSNWNLFLKTDETDLIPGKGYLMARDKDSDRTDINSGNGVSDWQKTIRFRANTKEDLNLSDVSFIMDKNDGTQWNLVANPFMNWIETDKFLNGTNGDNGDQKNIDQLADAYAHVYGYNGTDGGFTAYSSAGDNSKDISPGQGFFLATDNHENNINFYYADRVTDASYNSNTGAFITNPNRVTENESFYLHLNMNNGTTNRKAKFYFNDNMTTEIDRSYDAGSFDARSKSFSIFSLMNSNGIDFEIQALPIANTIIALGVNTQAGVNNIISISKNTLENDFEIVLEDRSKNIFTNLNKGDYNFVNDTDSREEDRFFIHVQNNALNTPQADLEVLRVTALNKSISIQGLNNENYLLEVIDLNGKKIHSSVVNYKSNNVKLNNANKGVYVVKISKGSAIKTQKLIVK